MKYIVAILLIFTSHIVFSQNVVKTSLPDPVPGRMYSKDAGGPAPKICFEPLSTEITNSRNEI